MDDDIGVANRTLDHIEIIGIALDKGRTGDGAPVGASQTRHVPTGVAKGDHGRVADMSIAAQNRHFTLGHCFAPCCCWSSRSPIH